MSYFENQYNAVRYPISLNGKPGLRIAQLGAIHAVAAHFTLRDEPAIVVMPTGSGKTAVSMLVAFLERALRVLVVTPSRLVRNQIAEEYKTLKVLKKNEVIALETTTPNVREVESKITSDAGWNELRIFDVIVSVPNSVSPAIEEVAQPPDDLFDLIIVDEAHHSTATTWNSLLASFPKAKRVLFTATPFRRDKGEITGKLVYDYPLNKAYEDKIFGNIEYIPVEPQGVNNDVAVAQKAEQVFNDDRNQNLEHFLMVRTDTKTRANELKKIYDENTKLNLQLVHSGLAYNTIKKTISRLQNKELDGIICVNMLGEGFDFPNLKIAAIHSPHKSLPVTLQFIGRFARTNADNIKTAKFIAVPAEIKSEVDELYKEGAIWQEIVTNLSRGRIEEEVIGREMMSSFRSPTNVTIETADISLYALHPYNHVKIYSVEEGADTLKPIKLPKDYSLVFRQPSPELSAVVLIAEEKTSPRWTNLELFIRTEYHLFVVYFDEETGLLFINSSCRNDSLYEYLSSFFSNSEPKQLPLNQVVKVLLELNNFEFFSIGMRSRIMKSNSESYRMISGANTQNAVTRRDGKQYHQGHVFGRARHDDNDVTIGYSGSSKVWSNTYSRIPNFVIWCRELAKRLISHQQVITNSGLDFLTAGESINEIPDGVIAADWDRDAYDHPRIVYYYNVNGSRSESQLLDFELKIDRTNCTQHSIRVSICKNEIEWSFDFNLNADYEFIPLEPVGLQDVIVVRGSYPESLIDYLNGNPLNFYFADFSKLHGTELYKSGNDEIPPFDANQIDVVDWNSNGVDIEKEFGILPSGKFSIQEHLKTDLVKPETQIVFYDHGSGEIADLITFSPTSDGVIIRFYHCKASCKSSPGCRVEDIYEVCGQTVKSLVWTRPKKLIERIAYRNHNHRDSAFLKGSLTELKMLLAQSKISFEIIMVQPGISQSQLKDHVGLILAAADDYIKSECLPLRLLASS